MALDTGRELSQNAQMKAAFILLLQKLRMDAYLHQHLTKKKREEVQRFNNDMFLDTLALLKISNDNLLGAQNYIENLAESNIIPYSKEFWERVSFILTN